MKNQKIEKKDETKKVKMCAVCGQRKARPGSNYCCLNCEDYSLEAQANYYDRWYR